LNNFRWGCDFSKLYSQFILYSTLRWTSYGCHDIYWHVHLFPLSFQIREKKEKNLLRSSAEKNKSYVTSLKCRNVYAPQMKCYVGSYLSHKIKIFNLLIIGMLFISLYVINTMDFIIHF